MLVESDELTAVELIFEEVFVHAGNLAYHEDLKAIIELLRLSHDPDVEQKLVAVLNSAEMPPEGVKLLQDPYTLGDTRAVLVEGPSREAIELVEIA